MKKLWVLALIFAVAMSAAVLMVPFKTSGQENKFQESGKPIHDSYIVVLNEDVVGRDLTADAIAGEANFLAGTYGGETDKLYASALKGFSIRMSAEQAKALSEDERVAFVEEDSEISVDTVQGGASWHLDRVDQRNMPLNTTYEYTATGAGVHAYILDTGIRPTHADFGGRASAVYDNIGDGQDGFDCNGHGTHVAGIIGSSTYGVAKNTFLHGVRVLPCVGNGQLSNLLAGIDWVTANRINPAVANISITAGGSSPALEAGLTNSVNSGVTFVVSAGNASGDACNFTPARTPAAITVGASDSSDSRAGYSNYGTCLDVFAPGTAVVSLSNASDTGTAVRSGTSMAAPVVAGAAATYLQMNPTATPASVSQAIVASATFGVLTTNDTSSPNRLLYSWLSGSPSPSPTPTPLPSPTATPNPSPSPNAARVTIKKRVRNLSGPSTTTAFSYDATNLSATNFSLLSEQIFVDPDAPPSGTANPIVVRENSVAGFRLASIECTEVSGGAPTSVNSTIDLTNRRVNIIAEPTEQITCTFTSDQLAPTASTASISGRVGDMKGRAVNGVTIAVYNMGTGEVRTSTSNSFGFYMINGLPTGQAYMIVGVSTKRWTVQDNTRTVNLNDDLAGMDFIAVRD